MRRTRCSGVAGEAYKGSVPSELDKLVVVRKNKNADFGTKQSNWSADDEQGLFASIPVITGDPRHLLDINQTWVEVVAWV